jgi:hypothetical protein
MLNTLPSAEASGENARAAINAAITISVTPITFEIPYVPSTACNHENNGLFATRGSMTFASSTVNLEAVRGAVLRYGLVAILFYLGTFTYAPPISKDLSISCFPPPDFVSEAASRRLHLVRGDDMNNSYTCLGSELCQRLPSRRSGGSP